MAQKYEKQITTKVEGFSRTVDGEKGITIKGRFFTMKEIFEEVKDGDVVKISLGADVAVEGGVSLDDEEDDYEDEE